MAKSTRPRKLGFYITIRHPISETEHDYSPQAHEQIAAQSSDADGDDFQAGMGHMRGEQVMSIQIRRGMNPQEAATLLRKAADFIEAEDNKSVLNLVGGDFGNFVNGVFESYGFPNDDTRGDPEPEIIPPPPSDEN